MRPLNHVPGREGGLKVAVQRAYYANRPRNKKKRHIVMRCVWAKGRAVGLEQSGAIKTGHGSEGPSRPSAARRWGEGARWGPFTLSNLLQYFQSSAAYSRSVSARFFTSRSFCLFTRDPLRQITWRSSLRTETEAFLASCAMHSIRESWRELSE